jgi:NAD(P)H-dependent flavin oxidoreductase YrpB (nitropropane dioxygenase family)
MIHTRLCDLLGIRHPIVLGGMGAAAVPKLVAAVSNSGGFGTLGTTALRGEQIAAAARTIREATDRPFGINHLLFRMNDEDYAQTLSVRPNAVAFAWANKEQDLRSYFDRAHEAGIKAMYMAPTVPEAVRAASAGADLIIAQGSEGGGHVGWMATMVIVPMVVSAVAPVPVLAAGGIADGRGVAAALALGADGALIGTRFLATPEAPLHANFKQAIVDSDGHDTVLTEIHDLASGHVWPGAVARVQRNAVIERWIGREWALRQNRVEVSKALGKARQAGDVNNATLMFGQDAGLIDSVKPAAEIIQTMILEAEKIIRERLHDAVRG